MMDEILKGIVSDEDILVTGIIDTETVEKARLIHDTYPTVSAALGRAMSGTLMLSSQLKEEQKLTLQLLGDGPIKEIIVDADWRLWVRVYVPRPHVHVESKNGKLNVGRALGKGLFSIIKDLGMAQPYRSTIPMESGEIAEDFAYYLNVSEQIPSAVSLGVFVDAENSVKASGGFMVQALPGAKDHVIQFLEQRINSLPPFTTMLLEGMMLVDILQKAVGLPFHITERRPVSYQCSCSIDRVMRAIVALGEKEVTDFIEKKENLEVQCEFCKKEFILSPEQLGLILEKMTSPIM